MKNIKIKKSKYFSSNSNIYVLIDSKSILIKDFGLYTIPVSEGEHICASQLWTSSKKIGYEELNEKVPLIIRPKLSRLFAIITGILFLTCSAIFIYTRYRWSYLPLVPIIVYVFAYLTILKNRYLVIERSGSDLDN